MTEPARSDASEHLAARVAVFDCTGDGSVTDDQLRTVLGSEVGLIHLPGPVGSAEASLVRRAAVFTGADGKRRWADAVPLLAAAVEGSGALRRIAMHGGGDVILSADVTIPFDGAPMIDRAAHLLDVVQAGQFVSSDVGAALLDAEFPTALNMTDLGWHRLRDLGPPVRVWHVSIRGSAKGVPALRSLDTFRHNLPIMHSSLVGRDEEVRVLERLLTETSCVTLTGSGGVGKSRLALAVGARTIEQYPGGVWWVELVSISDDGSVDGAVKGLLEREVFATTGPDEHSVAAPTLLVLDNCEQVARASARLVAELINQNPFLRVLSTSREPLGVSGETVWRVPSLALPSWRGDVDVVRLRSCSSVRLFTDRARAHDRTFELDDSNAASVAQICARLDGIPLAIELAAARCRQLGPTRVLANSTIDSSC